MEIAREIAGTGDLDEGIRLLKGSSSGVLPRAEGPQAMASNALVEVLLQRRTDADIQAAESASSGLRECLSNRGSCG